MIALLVSAGCTPARDASPEPSFIAVETSAESGSPELPLAFASAATSVPFTVRTLDRNGDPYPFDGDLTVRVRPGRLAQSARIPVRDGTWSGTIAFSSAFGPTRVWFSDEGDDERVTAYATGVSEPFHFAFPTIAQMQDAGDPETNHLAGEFAEILLEGREVVVTTVGTNGFWVTDLTDGPGAYASLFVYSFNKPRGVTVGSKLALLNGNNQEYLATTQLSWPDYAAEPDVLLQVPPPVVVPAEALCESADMERFESDVVEVGPATIPDGFTPGTADYDDYLQYGQWPIAVEGSDCVIYAESATTAPGFSPADNAGAAIGRVRGTLSEVFGKWIVGVRSPDDLPDLQVQGPPPAPPARLQPRSDPRRSRSHLPPR